MQHINHEAAIYYDGNADDFHVKVADTLEKACKLIETRFEHIADTDDKKLENVSKNYLDSKINGYISFFT